jgi:hypothetical protein
MIGWKYEVKRITSIAKYLQNFYFSSCETLQELVERATPKKPLDVCTPVVKWGLCPVCKGELNKLGGKPNRVFSNQKYCPDCGQALDWSEEE